MWDEMNNGFKTAFEAGWIAYKKKTIPIGAAIVDEFGKVITVGRNQIYSNGDGLISHHQLAHAEINAILKLSEIIQPNMHPNIRKYTLYTVMEPCPLCFGAIVMGSIRYVKFAARDGYAGSAELNSASGYIKRKKISIEGPIHGLEEMQLAIQSCYEMERNGRHDLLISSWKAYCPVGIEVGEQLFKDKILKRFAEEDAGFEKMAEYVYASIERLLR